MARFHHGRLDFARDVDALFTGQGRRKKHTPQGEATGRVRCRRLVQVGYQADMSLAPGLSCIFEASSQQSATHA